MLNNEDNRQLVDDLIFYYEEKKRLFNKHYRYTETPADRKHFLEAASLCAMSGLDAGTYVQLLYDRMGDKTQFFSPDCLQGTKVKHYLQNREAAEEVSTKVEITNHNIDPAALWRHQLELVQLYTRNGEPIESVLLDSSLKLFAWFRILCTAVRIPSVIEKYKSIAKKEMTSRLTEFAKSENLDLDRLL